ncbi:MAG: hypothetical protein EA386_15600 [Rhodobacteraceae bacterium]|nr:MAG: hypothetical protein EA386_15600 [Paracoccaceae bacterium]
MKKMLGAALSVAMTLTALPALAQTVCSNANMAGVWFGGDGFSSCRMTVQANGRFAALCRDEFDDDADQFIVRGALNMQSDCRFRMAARSDDDPSIIRFIGRAWGGGQGDETRPIAFNIATNPLASSPVHQTLSFFRNN